MLDTLKEQFTGKLLRAAVWATDDPKSFFLMLAVCMTPFLLLSALLSWKLRGAIKVSLCSDFFFSNSQQFCLQDREKPGTAVE
ncbi:unnamed protein product [Gongylonema pulchrum]|uniref:Small integral membrane protein 15 n=1 Tax=Gongylonema pulchrum TaxID=637853 RepID=A0A183E8S8_9BILA|nr:unnamed protein product [Gongylonema pulchrum]